MAVAVARCMVHRLHVPVGLRIVAFRRLLYLREYRFFFFLATTLYPITPQSYHNFHFVSVGFGVRDVMQLALDVLQRECYFLRKTRIISKIFTSV